MQKRIERLRKQIADQEQWIEACGLTLEGYVNRYGTATDINRHGDGGEAIWIADLGRLQGLRMELEILTGLSSQKTFVVTVETHGEREVFGPMAEGEADIFTEGWQQTHGENSSFHIEELGDHTPYVTNLLTSWRTKFEGETIWAKIQKLNKLHREIRRRKEAGEVPCLHACSTISSILNAYREGDLSFDDSIEALRKLASSPNFQAVQTGRTSSEVLEKFVSAIHEELEGRAKQAREEFDIEA